MLWIIDWRRLSYSDKSYRHADIFCLRLLTQCKHKPIKTCNCIFVAAWLIFMWTRADIQGYHTLHPPRNRHIGAHHITHFPLLSSILGPAVRVLPQTRTMTCFFVSPSTPQPLPYDLWCEETPQSLTSLPLFQKQNNCYLFLSYFFVVTVAAAQRLGTMAHSEKALWVYLLAPHMDDVVKTKEGVPCFCSGDWTHLDEPSQNLFSSAEKHFWAPVFLWNNLHTHSWVIKYFTQQPLDWNCWGNKC